MTSALVLSGGGNLGVVQVAFIEALHARGVKFDLIVGTSVGALNGAMLAAQPPSQPPDRLAEIWLGLRKDRLFHRNPLRIGRNMIASRLSLNRDEFVRGLVGDHLPVQHLHETRVPLCVTATTLTQGERKAFERGELLSALLASTAIPGVFPPVQIDGEWFVNGGIAAGLGLDVAIERGADTVLAVDLTCGGGAWRPRALNDVVTRSIQVAGRRRADAMLAQQAERACVVVWRPGLIAPSGGSSFRDTDFLLAQVREMAGGLIDLARDPGGRFRPGLYEGPGPAPPDTWSDPSALSPARGLC